MKRKDKFFFVKRDWYKLIEKLRSFTKERVKVYLEEGESAPEGKTVETGPRGGRFYWAESMEEYVEEPAVERPRSIIGSDSGIEYRIGDQFVSKGQLWTVFDFNGEVGLKVRSEKGNEALISLSEIYFTNMTEDENAFIRWKKRGGFEVGQKVVYESKRRRITYINSLQNAVSMGEQGEGMLVDMDKLRKYMESPWGKAIAQMVDFIELVEKHKTDMAQKEYEAIVELRHYTGPDGNYDRMNRVLREDKDTLDLLSEGIIKDMRERADRISYLLEKHPVKYEGVVWRGMKVIGHAVDLAEFIRKLESSRDNQEPFEWKGFASASKDEGWARNFGAGNNQIVFKINSKTACPLDGLSAMTGEEEVLFNRGTKFVVKSIKEVVEMAYNTWEVELDEV